MVVFVDMDGTICTELPPAQRPQAQPIEGALEAVNGMVAAGHTIVIWTGRGWHEYVQTKKWLDDHGFKYAQLLMGKPIANVIIDDRARQFVGWHVNYLERPMPAGDAGKRAHDSDEG